MVRVRPACIRREVKAMKFDVEFGMRSGGRCRPTSGLTASGAKPFRRPLRSPWQRSAGFGVPSIERDHTANEPTTMATA
jgi:hypothetical protein